MKIQPLPKFPITFGEREVTLTDLHNALIPLKGKIDEIIEFLNN